MKTLAEIDCADKPTINVYNKIDVLDNDKSSQKISWVKKTRRDPTAVYISAHKKENIDLLKAKLLPLVKKRHYQIFPNYLKSEYR